MRKDIHIVIFILICAGLAVAFSSCAKKQRQPVYPVHGQVFDKNGRPASGAQVIFHPVDASSPDSEKPLGRVDEKGNFALTTYEKNDGGPEGQYIITIQWRRQPTNPLDANKESQDRLQGRYSSTKTSKLKFQITNQQDNTVPPIHLQ